VKPPWSSVWRNYTTDVRSGVVEGSSGFAGYAISVYNLYGPVENVLETAVRITWMM
jgi:hypothetical protein